MSKTKSSFSQWWCLYSKDKFGCSKTMVKNMMMNNWNSGSWFCSVHLSTSRCCRRWWAKKASVWVGKGRGRGWKNKRVLFDRRQRPMTSEREGPPSHQRWGQTNSLLWFFLGFCQRGEPKSGLMLKPWFSKPWLKPYAHHPTQQRRVNLSTVLMMFSCIWFSHNLEPYLLVYGTHSCTYCFGCSKSFFWYI